MSRRLSSVTYRKRFLCGLMFLGGLLLASATARAEQASEQLVLATHKLDGNSSSATGLALRFRNGAVAILTANHVLQQMKGDQCVIVGRVKRDDGTYARREISVPIRSSGTPRWIKHSSEDLALLPISTNMNLYALAAESLASQDRMKVVHTGDSVSSCVFPERMEANPAGFPVVRGGTIASFPLVPVRPYPVFLVDATTWKGDSGGPVMHAEKRAPDGGPLVIGIVRGMRSVTDTTRESRFVEKRMHYPLGIAEVLQAALVWDFVPESWNEATESLDEAP